MPEPSLSLIEVRCRTACLDGHHWEALAAAGWAVGEPEPLDPAAPIGHPDRSCSKEFPSLRDGILEWERVTGKRAEDGFYDTDYYEFSGGGVEVEGERDVVEVLCPGVPTDLRGAAEMAYRSLGGLSLTREEAERLVDVLADLRDRLRGEWQIELPPGVAALLAKLEAFVESRPS